MEKNETLIGKNCGHCVRRLDSMAHPICTERWSVEEETGKKFTKFEQRKED